MLQGLVPSSGNQLYSVVLSQSVQLMDPDLQFQAEAALEMAEGKVPRAALFLAPVQLSHGNFSWLVAGLFFSLAFRQNHPIALR